MIATCPSCKARYRLEVGRLKGGRGRLKCARCGQVFSVGESAAEPPPAAQRAGTPPAAQRAGTRPAGQRAGTPPAAQRARTPPAAQRAGTPPAAQRAGTPPPAQEQSPAVQRLFERSKSPISSLAVAVVGCEPGPLRESLVSVLAKAGVRTLTTDDGPTCLDMSKRTRPKLVVASSYLPGLTGPELAHSMRGEPALASTRILLLAGAGTAPPPAGSMGADALLSAADAARELAFVLPRLLGGDPAEPALAEDEVRRLERQARVAASELLLYHPRASDRSALEADAEETRNWLAAQWPATPRRARDSFDAAMREQDAS